MLLLVDDGWVNGEYPSLYRAFGGDESCWILWGFFEVGLVWNPFLCMSTGRVYVNKLNDFGLLWWSCAKKRSGSLLSSRWSIVLIIAAVCAPIRRSE